MDHLILMDSFIRFLHMCIVKSSQVSLSSIPLQSDEKSINP